MSWQPVKGSSALASVVWGVVLSDPLVQRHQELIEASDAEIKRVLPAKSVAVQAKVEVDPATGAVKVGSGASDPDQPAGVKYARVEPNGSNQLEMSIDGSSLIAISQRYNGWCNAKCEVLQLFGMVERALRVEPGPPLHQLELQYKDVFWWDGEWSDGALADLLNQDPKLTPAWIFGTGSFWHHDVGEIVSRDDENIVERLAIHCMERPFDGQRRRTVVMDTTTRWLGMGSDQPLVSIHGAFERYGVAERCFEIMHDAAKDMYDKTLTRGVRERLNG